MLIVGVVPSSLWREGFSYVANVDMWANKTEHQKQSRQKSEIEYILYYINKIEDR